MTEPDPVKKLRICLLAPWYGGSHRRWADEYKEHSIHRLDIYFLPSIHWKWRMHGAAITLAEKFLKSGESYDLIIADDMMDVAVFAAIVRKAGVNTPVVTYFHENQICYPLSPRDTDLLEGRDLRYGYINYTSALVSERVYFNSHYHRTSFLDSLQGFLNQYPDFQNLDTIREIAEKSEVLPLGLGLTYLDQHQPVDPVPHKETPILLWNHRREYDKNPQEFFELLLALRERNISFQVAMLGKQSSSTRSLFESIHNAFQEAVIQDAEVKDQAEYAEWLWRADILPVTSNQDFFGGSVIEAVYCGCHPLLPDRLAFSEHFAGHSVYYSNPEEAVDQLEALIRSGSWKERSSLSSVAARYKWEILAPVYDQAFTGIDSNC